MWSEALVECARAKLDELRLTGVRYPELLIQELPKHDDPAITGKIEEIARLAVKLNDIDTMNLCEKVITTVKGLPRMPARKTFMAAVAAARKAAKTVEEAKSSAEGASPSAVRRDLAKMKNHVTMRDGQMFRDGIAGEERISNFSVTITARVVQDDGPACWRVRVDVPELAIFATEGNTTRPLVAEWIVPVKAWIGSKAFMGAFPHEEMVWSGPDADVQAALECALRNAELEKIPTIRSTTVIGRHVAADGTDRFVLPHGTIGPGRTFLVSPDLVLAAHGSSHLHFALPPRSSAPTVCDSEELLALAREVFPHLLLVNDPLQMAKLVGWGFAALWAPCLRAVTSGCPSFNVLGTTESGKTTAIKIVWQILSGVVLTEPIGLRSTAFTAQKNMASSNAIFLPWDEMKNHDAAAAPKGRDFRAEFVNASRCAFTAEVISRGRPDGTMLHLRQVAPHVLGAEDRLEGDEALHSRTIFATFGRHYIGNHPVCATSFGALRALPLHRLGVFLQAWSIRTGNDWQGTLDRARALVTQSLAALGRTPLKLQSRLVDAMAWVTFGLLQFDAICAEVGAAAPNVALEDVLQSMIADAWSVDVETLTAKTDARPRTSFDLWALETSVAAGLGILKDGTHYAVIDGKIHLPLTLIEGALSSWRRQKGSSAPLGLPALHAQSKEMCDTKTSYVVEVRKQLDIGGVRRRCVVLDPARVPEGLDLQPFPVADLRTWGGARPKPTAEELLAEFGTKGGGDRGPN